MNWLKLGRWPHPQARWIARRERWAVSGANEHVNGIWHKKRRDREERAQAVEDNKAEK